jgi:hypothetical protein
MSNKSMTFDTYSKFSIIKSTEEAKLEPGYEIDPITNEVVVCDKISLEPINFTGRNYISYLQLVNGCPNSLIQWDTQNAYLTFIQNRVKFDPFTKLPLNPGFIQRIQLYQDSITNLGKDYKIEDSEIKELFKKYLVNNVDEREKLILRSYLFLDSVDIIHTFSSTGINIRDDAEQYLKNDEIGSWMFRTGSWVESELITTKVITSIIKRVEDMDGVSNSFIHIPIVHVKGYGYYMAIGERGLTLPNTGDKIKLPEFDVNNSTIFPCMIDLLTYCHSKKYIKLDKYKFKEI